MGNPKAFKQREKALLFNSAFFSLFLLMILVSIRPLAAQTHLEIESKKLKSISDLYIYKVGNSPKKIIYITDGKKMIDNGFMQSLQSLQIGSDLKKSAYYIFVSSIDSQTGNDRRNEYFFCNKNYLSFFEEELIPAVEDKLGQSFEETDRILIGVSFGGLSAAFFSAYSDFFQTFILLSPITYPCGELHSAIALSEIKNQRIYISTGKNDAESYAEPLRKIYQSKGSEVKYVETEGGHDFDNWNAQLSSVLNFINK